jgi:hypothetical protein
MEALFLEHEGYFGALGAFLSSALGAECDALIALAPTRTHSHFLPHIPDPDAAHSHSRGISGADPHSTRLRTRTVSSELLHSECRRQDTSRTLAHRSASMDLSQSTHVRPQNFTADKQREQLGEQLRRPSSASR